MKRILVVDDDPDFVEITRLVLTAKGYEVDTASDGNMALRKLRESPPDLVLLDVMMSSVLDGVHVAHAIEEDERLHGVPVIMVSSITGSPNADLFPTDEYLPIDSWLSKPVQPDALVKKVEALLGASSTG
ncbi:MAG: response regulator [Chloroflexi bacterium]|nr:response regulator [Chloroflexota bacterium]